jgi:hypothetical protein
VKNANIFVDVDLTLVDSDGRLLEGAGDALRKLHASGSHLYLWSTAGADYARKVAGLDGLTELFEGFSAKPDIVIDDMPATARASFEYNVHEETSWPALADKILRKHIDPR